MLVVASWSGVPASKTPAAAATPHAATANASTPPARRRRMRRRRPASWAAAERSIASPSALTNGISLMRRPPAGGSGERGRGQAAHGAQLDRLVAEPMRELLGGDAVQPRRAWAADIAKAPAA